MPIPYPPAEVAGIEAVMRRAVDRLETASPVIVANTDTREAIIDFTHPPTAPLFTAHFPLLIFSASQSQPHQPTDCFIHI